MEFRIPVGTEIIPYNSNKRVRGISRSSTIMVIFEATEIIEVISISGTDYYRLALEDNPSDFDSYLLKVAKVETQLK